MGQLGAHATTVARARTPGALIMRSELTSAELREALIGTYCAAYPSVVLPSEVFSRALGTTISTFPKVPSSERDRWPWR